MAARSTARRRRPRRLVVGALVLGVAAAVGSMVFASPFGLADLDPTRLTADPDTRAIGPKTRTVEYRDLRLVVPADWPVHDLDAHPETCVRFDENAVYLGKPGTDQDCPARAIGRADAVLVEPVTKSRGLSTAASLAKVGDTPSVADDGSPENADTFVLSGTALAVTATYVDDPTRVDAIVRSARYDGPRRELPKPRLGDLTQGLVDSVTPSWAGYSTRFSGQGFDTCAAPSKSAMSAWLKSPFRTVGIYIGGLNRACGDGNLDADWVRSVTKQGWRLLPIYVGHQAPCAFQKGMAPINPKKAAKQGREGAKDAVKKAQKFGLYAGSAIYFDIEGYDDRKKSCKASVMSFLREWTKKLHDLGYLSGVYSSASSGIKNLAQHYDSHTLGIPDAIWTARWDNKGTIWNERYVSNSKWAVHQRVKQYRGPHTETWGGKRINIDSNVMDTTLASVSYTFNVVANSSLRARSGPGTTYKELRTFDAGTPLKVMCQSYGEKVKSDPVWNKLSDGTYVSDAYVATKSKTGLTRPIPLCSYPYPISGDSLRMRTAPSTTAKERGSIPKGGLAFVMCQRAGQKVGASNVWNKLDNGAWVADQYVLTPGRPKFSRTIPRCPSWL